MTIAFRDDVANAANSTTYTLTNPVDVQVGDFGLLVIGFTGTTVTNPTGWTQQGSDIIDSALTVRVLWKIAVSGDIGAGVVFGANTTSHFAGSIIWYSGVAQIGEFHTNLDGSAGTSHATTALSAMAASSSWAADFWVEKSTSNPSWTVPGTVTQRTNKLFTGSGVVTMCSGDSNGGVASQTAQTATSGNSTKGVNISVELQASAAVVAPGAPTAVTGTAGNAAVSVAFTPGTTGGAPVTYTATSTPGSHTASGSASPLNVTGLTNGTGYTFIVTATNSAGSTPSSPSGSVTPAAPPSGTIAFRDSAAPTNSNTATRSVTVPSDVQVGDTLLMLYGWSNVATSNNPTGWTQIGTDTVAGSFTVRLFTKTAVTADIGATVSFTASATSKWAIGVVAYSGVAGIGEVEINTDGSAGTTHLTTALTTMAASGSWALAMWIEKSTTNTSWSGPLTQRVNNIGSGAGANSLLIVDSDGIVSTLAAQTATSGVSTTSVNLAVELLAGAAVTAPGAPTGVSAVAGDGTAVVSFTPGTTGGGVVTYTAISNPGGFTASGSGSPLTVGGLTDGTAYTFTVRATNAAGNATSSASGSVTPAGLMTPFIGIIPIVGGPLIGPPPPPNNSVLLGMATGSSPSYQDAWNAKAGVAGPGVTVYRSYSTGIPATWSARTGNAVVGPTTTIFSFTPDPTTTISGGQDAALQALARTIPAGTYVCPWHEPEQKTKPFNDPTVYGQMFARVYAQMKGANPALNIGCIMEAYTFNRRPTDAFGHGTAGINEWMNAAAADSPVDWVGFDCYPPGPNPRTNPGAEQNSLASELFIPGTQLALVAPTALGLVCEYGMWTGPERSSSLVDGYSYMSSDETVTWAVLAYWDEDNSTVSNGIDALLTTPELQVFGGLLGT